MTHCFDVKNAIAALLVAAAFVAPDLARAQSSLTKANASPGAETLNGQEREMLDLALDLSRRCADALERWLATGEVNEDRLFARLYYPIANTDPPKFNTDWDKFSDRDILPIEEATKAKSPAIVFALMTDVAGYVPTHNQEFSRAASGDRLADLNWSRSKRIFNDKAGLSAARSTAPFMLQVYQRDTGERVADMSVPITVRGKHWGAARIAYRIRE